MTYESAWIFWNILNNQKKSLDHWISLDLIGLSALEALKFHPGLARFAGGFDVLLGDLQGA